MEQDGANLPDLSPYNFLHEKNVLLLWYNNTGKTTKQNNKRYYIVGTMVHGAGSGLLDQLDGHSSPPVPRLPPPLLVLFQGHDFFHHFIEQPEVFFRVTQHRVPFCIVSGQAFKFRTTQYRRDVFCAWLVSETITYFFPQSCEIHTVEQGMLSSVIFVITQGALRGVGPAHFKQILLETTVTGQRLRHVEGQRHLGHGSSEPPVQVWQ
ncbi:hypothetical protein AGLY_011642 [Aphis glycines]|uniref:Uncharacterized protein n=1 Tax=Aphis glycines TaxID=307491 RepID=A0A6G0TAS8_APHGL|nr:hypothetical protein AGLY_011642 [Aphis glycines]